jgi:hypothetical protein
MLNKFLDDYIGFQSSTDLYIRFAFHLTEVMMKVYTIHAKIVYQAKFAWYATLEIFPSSGGKTYEID